MFAASDDVVNLGNLPWDIVGKIIKIGIESIDNIKPNVLAAQFLKGYRKYFPKINEFMWGCCTSNQRTVKVRIPIKYREYFGFKECHRPHIPENSTPHIWFSSLKCCSPQRRNRDIVGKLIKVGIESVDNMKLISPRWNGLAVEVLAGDRKYFPKLDELNWGVDQSGQHTFEYLSNIDASSDLRSGMRLQRYSRSLLVHSEFGARLVKRCSSIDCAQIALGENFKSQKIHSLSDNMQHVPIVELKFDVTWNLYEVDRKAIVDFVRAHSVQRLCLTTDLASVFEEYFLDLLYPTPVFFTQALLTAKSVELAVKTPVGIWAMLLERYNWIAADLAPRLIVNLKSHTETLVGGEMRLHVIVTRYGDA
uniref:Uncharacterized protein n=1 Tax=Pristionchus pacificus TaxID=54126 RepID=A0A8R1U7G3_PRIPA